MPWSTPPSKSQSPGCRDENVFNQTFIIYMTLQHRPVTPGWRIRGNSVAVCACTRVGYNFCNPHGLQSTYEFWCIGTLVNLLRKSCRWLDALQSRLYTTVEVKVRLNCLCAKSYEYLMRWCHTLVPPWQRARDKITPIAPPTGCGIDWDWGIAKLTQLHAVVIYWIFISNPSLALTETVYRANEDRDAHHNY